VAGTYFRALPAASFKHSLFLRVKILTAAFMGRHGDFAGGGAGRKPDFHLRCVIPTSGIKTFTAAEGLHYVGSVLKHGARKSQRRDLVFHDLWNFCLAACCGHLLCYYSGFISQALR